MSKHKAVKKSSAARHIGVTVSEDEYSFVETSAAYDAGRSMASFVRSLIQKEMRFSDSKKGRCIL